MRNKGRIFDFIGCVICVILCNCSIFIAEDYRLLWFVFLAFIVVTGFTGRIGYKLPTGRLKRLNHGVICLKNFYITLICSIVWHIILLINISSIGVKDFFISAGVCTGLLNIIFWTGIIVVYLTSFQLGLKHRLWGILMGMIPIVNLFTLVKIIDVTSYEVELESSKIELNKKREKEQICKTKYPILLVHGVFFRDFEHINYWGRIPKELEANGAKVFYGKHSSAAPIVKSSEEITKRIKEVINETGASKVNIIAHSKGGLDVRMALDNGMAPYVASFTTINTPHRGCNFADYLLDKASDSLKEKIANTYNFAARKMGDKNPDFIKAVSDLTASRCKSFNEEHKNTIEGVYCQSVGSVMKGISGGQFPLNVAYPMVKHFDGEDDGLVSVDAFEFGERYIFLKPKYKRGISHGDVIDLSRENIKGFDVREFYVELVSDLKSRGY